jgi:hypothetical protein
MSATRWRAAGAGLVVLAGVIIGLLAVPARRPEAPAGLAAPAAYAAPNAFSGPVQGGCYLRSETACAIHVTGWQPVTVDQGLAIDAVRLGARRAGEMTFRNLYDFRTDVSNPPLTTYQLSPVRRDFAAACSASYELRVMARPRATTTFTEVGRTNVFTCPDAPTPTPTLTPTPTATATTTTTSTSTATPTATGTRPINATPTATPRPGTSTPTTTPPTATPTTTPPPPELTIYLPVVR